MPVLSKPKKPEETQHIPVRIYKLKHLLDEATPDEPKAWNDFGHTITIISHNPRPSDKTSDDLYVDHVHIHSENWNWIQKPNELVWKQGTSDDLIEGYACLSGDSSVGAGMVRFKKERSLESAQLRRLQPTYTLDVSTDAAGATLADDNNLTWDSSTKQWENAQWMNDALTYSYCCKDSAAGDFEFENEFTDIDSSQEWTPDARPFRHNENAQFSTVNVSDDKKLTFTYANGPPPPSDKFPYKMSFQFSPLGTEITGGAMLCKHPDSKGSVHALKGKKDNLYAVGSYVLSDQISGKPLPTKLSTHAKKLVIDKKPVPTSKIAHNKLIWHSLTKKQTETSGLPADGFVEFSADGKKVVSSSFNHIGSRESSPPLPGLTTSTIKPKQAKRVTPDKPEPFFSSYASEDDNLSVIQLMNMTPIGHTSDEKLIDEVQSKSIEDFYKIIQYYMPVDLRGDFFGPEPPDLGDLEPIAQDNHANGLFYNDLSIPYLVVALKSAGEDSTKKLNARRAQTFLRNSVAQSKVYQRQAGRLYSRQWLKKFPLMKDFLDDQQRNTPEQKADIDTEATLWKRNITSMGDSENQQKVIELIDQAVSAGKNFNYWAFKLFRRLCSPGQFLTIQQELQIGSSTTIAFQIKRYDSILTLLDPSGFFSQLYHEMLSIYIMTASLPSKFDFGENFDQVKLISSLLMKKFIDKYGDTDNEAIKNEVALVKESMRRGITTSVIGLLSFIVSESAGHFVWDRICQRLQTEWLKKFGTNGLKLMEAVVPFIGVVALGLIIGNAISWNEMSPVGQAFLVNNCLFVVVLLIRKSIKAIMMYSTTSMLEAMKIFLGKEVSKVQTLYITGFRRWLIRNAGVKKELQSVRYLAEAETVEFFQTEASFEESYPRFTKIFGRSLDEFMATRFSVVTSVLGIGLSAWSLSVSTTPISAATNTIFLIASTLDLAAGVGEWAISWGVEEIGGLAISQITSLLGVMSFIGCVAGFILLIVMFTQTSNPEDPVDKFVGRDDVKKLGFYMQQEAAIDYFQPIVDKNNLTLSVGTSISSGGSYLTLGSSGALTAGPDLTHSYKTVFTISTDYSGFSTIFSKVWTTDDDGKTSSTVVALTAQGSNMVIMRKKLPGDEDTQLQWIATCMGEVKYHDKEKRKYLQSALFTLESVYREGYFLTLKGNSIALEKTESPIQWRLNMEGMAPAHLTVPDMKFIMPNAAYVKFVPFLGQIGSLNNQVWKLTGPTLPDSLTFNKNTGVIECIKEPTNLFTKIDYTMKVENDYGSTSANFSIEISQAAEPES